MYVRLAGMRCPDQRLRGLIMLGRRGPPSGTSDPVPEPGADEWAASFGRLGTASSPPSALAGRFCCFACGTAERTLLSFCALCSASASNARSCCSDDGSSEWRQARALLGSQRGADEVIKAGVGVLPLYSCTCVAGLREFALAFTRSSQGLALEWHVKLALATPSRRRSARMASLHVILI